MPNLTVVVPTARVAELTDMAEAYLTTKGIVWTGWTATQKGQRYIAEMLKDRLIAFRGEQAQLTARQTEEQTVLTALATAKIDADTITG